MHENCEHVYALTDSVETYTITPSYVYLHKMHTAFYPPDIITPRLRWTRACTWQRWCSWWHWRGGWCTCPSEQLLTITDSSESRQWSSPPQVTDFTFRFFSFFTGKVFLVASPRLWITLIVGCNKLRFGCFILKCSQVCEMMYINLNSA